jgi:hypothetical protein
MRAFDLPEWPAHECEVALAWVWFTSHLEAAMRAGEMVLIAER